MMRSQPKLMVPLVLFCNLIRTVLAAKSWLRLANQERESVACEVCTMMVNAADDTETGRKLRSPRKSSFRRAEPLHYPGPHSYTNLLMRILWRIVWLLVYRPSTKVFHGWRRYLLRMFGAKIANDAYP